MTAIAIVLFAVALPNAVVLQPVLNMYSRPTVDADVVSQAIYAANVVAFYENYGWGVRLAYNWRDEFLSSRFDGAGPSPNYTEEYGQFDLNVSYQWGDNLTLQAEAINLTDEIQRIHGRTDTQALFVTQTGPRYMIGARYKFGQ